MSCCNELFEGFQFQRIQNGLPPTKRGVHVIRIKEKGKDVSAIKPLMKQLIGKLDWPMVGTFILSRLQRLEKIEKCPVIYIGSAGTHKNSSNTLRDRYQEFSNRHTIMYPLWTLIYFGWELQYGWKVASRPAELEKELKESYRKMHNAKLPALVQL